MQLRAGLARAGLRARAMHPIELLDRAQRTRRSLVEDASGVGFGSRKRGKAPSDRSESEPCTTSSKGSIDSRARTRP